MIIDLIQERQNGEKIYNPREFYFQIMAYGEIFPDLAHPIAEALDSGTDEEVKRELARYIVKAGYPLDFINYINSQSWL